MWRSTATFLLIVSLLETDLTAQDGPIAHWRLEHDTRDISTADRTLINHGVTFDQTGAAVFDGKDDWLELPSQEIPKLGTGCFTISVWIHTEEILTDVLGDIMACYDARTRTGFNLTLMNYSGVTNAQSNWRNILFGIDADQMDEKWIDCGRPGQSRYVRSLCVFNGELYASTWEPEEGDRGNVYRYGGGRIWIDCGAPNPSNCIASLAVYKGKLYAGSERYSGGGSSLPLSKNEQNGGVVYRYEGDRNWQSMGKVADVRSVSGLAVYGGRLYAGTGSTGAWRETPRQRGMYRFDGPGQWTDCGCPGLRVVHLGVHNDQLYGLSYDQGGFFSYQGGTQWKRLGPIPETTQAYSMMVYEGAVHVGTWPTGSVYRLDGPQTWLHRGRLGAEKEVMGISLYNGQLYAGTLPFADVYRYDGGTKWSSTGRLDHTPDVRYRRAWSMAVFQGKLYCGVLPSGRVLSLEAGKSATYDHHLASGWQHLTAVKDQEHLKIYLNGDQVSRSTRFDSSLFDLATDQPLKIGFGQHDYFNGKMKDIRIYDRALTTAEVRVLAKK